MILFTALLSPAVRALPGWTVGTAGESAWLTGILAFPPFLLLGWMVFSLCRRSGGLAQAYQDAFGPLAGKVVIVIYLSWALFLLCAEGRLYAERMLSAGYRSAAPWVFLLVLLGVVLWMGRRKLGAFARAAEICYLVLALTLGLVLLFSILDMSPEHVLPVWITDVPAVTAATLVPVGVLSCGVFGGFLGGTSPGVLVTPDRDCSGCWRDAVFSHCSSSASWDSWALRCAGAWISPSLKSPEAWEWMEHSSGWSLLWWPSGCSAILQCWVCWCLPSEKVRERFWAPGGNIGPPLWR